MVIKNFKLIYKTVAILLVCGLLTTCFKPIGEIRIDQESKDYCLFGVGSYWIYQDSATLEIDSIVINYPISYSFSGNRGNGHKTEEYHFGISSYSQDTTYFFSASLTTRDADPRLLKPCAFVVYHFATMYHNGEIRENVPNFRNIVLLDKKDSYSINEITFNNIKIFENTELNKKKLFYWAKHIGLIRTEIYENDSIIVKNLIKYNVKPYNQ